MAASAYFYTAALRIILTLLPQTGYLHPDEYFQSVEVFSGKILGLQVNTAWEFNGTLPIRSMTLPYLSIGVPFMAMKASSGLIRDYLNIDILHPYYLITVPRLIMTLLSFVCDYLLFKLADKNRIRPWSSLRIWSSSYIVLVFLTRTLSNSFEVLLFAALLCFVSDAMNHTAKFAPIENELDKRMKKAKFVMERVNIVKQRRKIPGHSYRHSVAVAAICTVGFFNRPTFLCYSVVPIFFWLQRGLSVRKMVLEDFHVRMLSLVPTCLIVSFFHIVLDSLFYQQVQFSDLWDLNRTLSNFIVTPYNFLLYNMNPDNLVQHGLHPWYLHSLVHTPLLFSVLGIGGIYLSSRAVFYMLAMSWNEKPKLFNTEGLLLFSFLFPLIILSFSPHQEPRFLLPLLIPLVLLLGPFVLLKPGLLGKLLRSLWFSWNVVCVLFFGFFHQGGIYGAQVSLHDTVLQARSNLTHSVVLYSHTYTPPQLLLGVPEKDIVITNGIKVQRKKSVFVEDLAGAPLLELRSRCGKLAEEARWKWRENRIKTDIFAVLPATLVDKLNKLFDRHPTMNLQLVKRVFPHISMEDPPNFTDRCSRSKFDRTVSCADWIPWIKSKLQQLSIVIYRVEYRQT